MLKGKYVLLSLAAAVVCWQVASVNNANSGIVDACKSTVTAASGVTFACPLGDGDPLTAATSGNNLQITLTVRDNANVGIAGIPATDIWLVGCNDGLLLCGGSSGSAPDAATNASGTTTFSNEPATGGCDTGLYAVVQGVVIQDAGTCTPKCLAIAVHTPDYKGAGVCPGDLLCADSKVDNSDFNWFVGHYPNPGNPGAPYLACADYAAPLGAPIDLSDFSKFVSHFVGTPNGHACPIIVP